MFGIKNKIQVDKLEVSFNNEENKKAIEILMSDPQCEHLFIVKTGAESVLLTTEPPQPEKFSKKGGVVAIKLTQEPLTLDNI